MFFSFCFDFVVERSLTGGNDDFPLTKGSAETRCRESEKKCVDAGEAGTFRPAWHSPGHLLEQLVVQELPGILHGQAEPFAPTQWSVIVAAGESQADPGASRVALA